MIFADHLWLLALALIVDAVLGDPDWLWRRLPHPVVWSGRLVGFLETSFNRPDRPDRWRRNAGIVSIAMIIGVTALAGWAIEYLFRSFAYGWISIALIAAIMLAGRSLYNHVRDVASALECDGVEAARRAVAKIVGRDPEKLDESAIGRAAIESAAENFSDGVVAPAFWFALLGLPGLFAYKAINTADSMIGHRSSRYRDYGWAAARLDDWVNWPAARLSGGLISLAAPLVSGSPVSAFRTMMTDAPNHRSPNAGWPEAAMSAALGIALAGPRSYGGVVVDDALMNRHGRRDVAARDIRNALRVYAGAWLACLILVLALALLL